MYDVSESHSIVRYFAITEFLKKKQLMYYYRKKNNNQYLGHPI